MGLLKIRNDLACCNIKNRYFTLISTNKSIVFVITTIKQDRIDFKFKRKTIRLFIDISNEFVSIVSANANKII